MMFKRTDRNIMCIPDIFYDIGIQYTLNKLVITKIIIINNQKASCPIANRNQWVKCYLYFVLLRPILRRKPSDFLNSWSLKNLRARIIRIFSSYMRRVIIIQGRYIFHSILTLHFPLIQKRVPVPEWGGHQTCVYNKVCNER